MTTRAQLALGALEAAGRPLLTSEVAHAMGKDARSASQVLMELLREGKVQRSKSGGTKAPPAERERRWRLTPVKLAG